MVLALDPFPIYLVVSELSLNIRAAFDLISTPMPELAGET